MTSFIGSGCLPVSLFLSAHRSIQAQIYKQWFCHLVIIADREIKYWFSSRGKGIAVQKLPILPHSSLQSSSTVTFYLRNLWLILTLMAFAAYEDKVVHFFSEWRCIDGNGCTVQTRLFTLHLTLAYHLKPDKPLNLFKPEANTTFNPG